MDEQSAPAAPVVKKTSRVCDKVVPESGSGFGVICIVVGSIIAASAVVAEHHSAPFLFGGFFFVMAGVARHVKKLAAQDDREFFG